MLFAAVVVFAARPAAAATCSTSTSANTMGTTIPPSLTAPIDTCTDGNIQINSSGSVKINTPSVAVVTINTNNNVNNGGLISDTGQSNVEGILIDATHGPLTFPGDGITNVG